MFDREGNEVDNIDEMFGRPTRFKLIKPERCVFVDETGCNTNQKEDNYNGGEQFVVPTGSVENGRNGITTDLHFTVLPFITGTGEALLCGIILQSDKDICDVKVKWKTGIDITKVKGSSESTVDVFEANLEEDGAMSGGPKCRINGVDVPCFVCTSPKNSITTELLIKMLDYIDTLGVYERHPNDYPFLMLDGHHSRTCFEFTDYVNTPIHKWGACIGVPYGTHIWQVADSSELNGCFKIALNREKMAYIKHRGVNERTFKQTDIVPLVNKAWKKSFARKDIAKKAIVDRGWSVLNYCLLDDPRIIKQSNSATSSSTEEITIASGSTSSSITTNTSVNEVVGLNTNGPVFTSYLYQIMAEEAKSQGRKRVFEEQKNQLAEKKRLIDDLEEGGNLSSGQLAIKNHYALDKELRQAYKKNKVEKKRVSDQQDKARNDRTKNDNKRFLHASIKYKASGRNNLQVNEMRALMKRIYRKGDSPMKTKVVDVQAQFSKRERRVMEYLDPTCNLFEAVDDDNEMNGGVVLDANDYNHLDGRFLFIENEMAIVANDLQDNVENSDYNGLDILTDVLFPASSTTTASTTNYDHMEQATSDKVFANSNDDFASTHVVRNIFDV